MKTTIVKPQPVTVYQSEVLPQVSTENEMLAKSIEWADAHPVAWKIVTGNRSKAYGKSSIDYLGYQRGDAPSQILDRIHHFKCYVDGYSGRGTDFWQWRAQFTLEHYNDRGFRGSFFHQFDGQYNRGCCTLDYTPHTLESVIDRFIAWCNVGYKFPTAAVKIDGKVVRTYRLEGV